MWIKLNLEMLAFVKSVLASRRAEKVAAAAVRDFLRASVEDRGDAERIVLAALERQSDLEAHVTSLRDEAAMLLDYDLDVGRSTVNLHRGQLQAYEAVINLLHRESPDHGDSGRPGG